MANFMILTNNPMALAKYPERAVFCDKSAEGVFTAVRDAVHKGSVLISHPLSGSIKPNESPYKSIVISEIRPCLDFRSLQLIEDALQVIKKLGTQKRANGTRLRIPTLIDYQTIDLDLLDSAMMSLPPEYY